jgi:hypothetical protein
MVSLRKGNEMLPITESDAFQAVLRTRAQTTTPAPLTTTLYDLIAALQDAAGPNEDTLVVATMMHLIHSGRLNWQCTPERRRRVMHLPMQEA